MIGLGFRLTIRRASSSPFELEALDLFDRFTTPPTYERKLLINSLIRSLKTAGVWAKLDALYLLAAANAQAARLNWCGTNYTISSVNSPAFTADRGYAGNGSSAYLSTGFNAFTAAGAKFLQDTAHVSIWDLTNRAAASASIEVGLFNGSSYQNHINTRYTGNVALGRVNQGLTAAMQPSVTSSSGYYVISRTGATAQAMYKDGALLASNSSASVALSNANDFIPLLLGKTVGGPLVNPSSDQLAAASIGGGLTSDDQAALYSAISTYLTAVGAI
ncbi:hypothetical protein [Ancylobacter sp. IITR112]|uniref:hypothetical protein n=1 Tax=Ancylobacter sp. IITR112 TaxID=3138073 RepID=UPI003529F958